MKCLKTYQYVFRPFPADVLFKSKDEGRDDRLGRHFLLQITARDVVINARG